MRIVLTAGGTGGHIFPAKAVADALKQEGHTVLFITDERGRGYTKLFESSRILTLKYQSGFWGRIKLLWRLLVSTFYMISEFRKLKPHRVVGFGGYPSIPAVLAGQLLRIPTFIHEQNVHLGKANRWLSKGAKKVIGSFAKTPTATFLGNAVRKDFFALKPYAVPSKNFNILILGGSLGSQIFGAVVPKALKKLPIVQQKQVSIVQQCRPELEDMIRAEYEGFAGKYTLKGFLEKSANEMDSATLIISRAGGTTIAEICAAGRPVILVPFAASKEGDQFYNALFMKEQGAAYTLSEYHFNADNLYKTISYLMNHKEELVEMARHAKRLSQPKAVAKMLDMILKES
ncbi:MAG: UDP-N-acetylglucosamine--N-acetylmuramyl-(pentapeptide) pyrophosphoryl-undecaprenol N-acetylglucosamine transferase [Alphaproteobacteria bacterium]|nr:MAG: UDP-N-acetylglucosamine--N-acetylmuramyl-(pentapeptide) pyrophosphoryl-undecaprenol N-acetylglucosamine transferase [Alphaproteobacteria bacterium]